MSKIHSESKSQLQFDKANDKADCVSLCQRYILKANHNGNRQRIKRRKLCLTMSKIHSESKSQRTAEEQGILQTVSHYVKDTF